MKLGRVSAGKPHKRSLLWPVSGACLAASPQEETFGRPIRRGRETRAEQGTSALVDSTRAHSQLGKNPHNQIAKHLRPTARWNASRARLSAGYSIRTHFVLSQSIH